MLLRNGLAASSKDGEPASATESCHHALVINLLCKESNMTQFIDNVPQLGSAGVLELCLWRHKNPSENRHQNAFSYYYEEFICD